MKLSAIVLSYRRPAYLQEALASISQQSERPDELIFSDCTSDPHELSQIKSILKAFESQNPELPVNAFFHEKPVEQTAHTHFAFEKCLHPLAAMLHDDDAWLPSHLETGKRALAADPQIGLYIANANVIESDGAPSPQREPNYPELPRSSDSKAWFQYLVRRYFSSFSAYIFRREITQGFPKFPTQVVDHHLAIHAALADFGISADRQPGILYRVHASDSNASITQRFSLQRERYKLYLKLLFSRPAACMRKMPQFPLFALKGLVYLACNRS